MDRHIKGPFVWLESKPNWPFAKPLYLLLRLSSFPLQHGAHAVLELEK